MRNFLFALTIFFSLSMNAQEIQLSWNKSMNVATEISKAENKPILIYFTKNDCKDCQQFYSDFFKQQAFNNLTDDFILLMLDGSNNDIKTTDINIIKQRRLVMHYNKSSTFPAVLVIDHEGKQLGELLTSKVKNDIENYWSFLETL